MLSPGSLRDGAAIAAHLDPTDPYARLARESLLVEAEKRSRLLRSTFFATPGIAPPGQRECATGFAVDQRQHGFPASFCGRRDGAPRTPPFDGAKGSMGILGIVYCLVVVGHQEPPRAPCHRGPIFSASCDVAQSTLG